MAWLRQIPIDALAWQTKRPEGSIVRDKTFLDMCFRTKDGLYTTLNEKTMAKWLSLSLDKATKKLIEALEYPRPDPSILANNTQRIYGLLEKVHHEMGYYSPKIKKLSVKNKTKYDITQKLHIWLKTSKEQNNLQLDADQVFNEQDRLDTLPILEQLLCDSIWYYTIRDNFYNKYTISTQEKWWYNDNKFIIDPWYHLWTNNGTHIMYDKDNNYVMSW